MDWFAFYTTQQRILYSKKKKLTLLSYKESIHRLKKLSTDIKLTLLSYKEYINRLKKLSTVLSVDSWEVIN